MASDNGDVEMTDDGPPAVTYLDEDVDEKYPNRPHNHSSTLPFHELYTRLFNPLNENKKKPTGPLQARRKVGPNGPGSHKSPHEVRREIVYKFIKRWRDQVGDDIYPAFRLIVPEKDRDRPMYGLKEKTIGKLLVKVMKIDKNSEDGQSLMDWKSIKLTSVMAGDFAGRCYEVVRKRPMRTEVGKLTIGDVNEMLDRLSAAQKEQDQTPIIEEFYKQMNAEEMMWLIRVILRQMKVGATEKTLFDIWHPDAESLFNVSSSLRRVCWELHSPDIRLEGNDMGISLMQCFQPQLAAFQMHSLEKMVARMNLPQDDPSFWIEEKLDGERMQLHMQQDPDNPGGKRFAFWSRKAKDYTYLYGNGFEDSNASLTKFIKNAFHPHVRNIILDGEMVTWDIETDCIVSFGTLKTAALSEQRNMDDSKTGQRPLFRVFDCLFLNDRVLTNYTLRDRYKALSSSVKSVHRRIEVHGHVEGCTAEEIEPHLRRVIAESSEGLVIKNPGSVYRLNERNDDWMKVKPEYMTEFGEALDCVVIGGYYGSGHRGGGLSSFMCGLRVNASQIALGAKKMKCYSFFKVGGGMTAEDYARIRHLTDGKWHDWDPKRPPTDYIELGGGDRQFERPDVWIKPDESIVLEVKAASVTSTDQFRMGLTLRFPRFKKVRTDKNWETALSIDDFLELKGRAETEKAEKQFKVDDARKQRHKRLKKKQITIVGQEQGLPAFAGPQTKLFEGKNFFVISESVKPKKTKADIEQMVKINGGILVQTEKDDAICVADRNLVKVASLKKAGQKSLIRPLWILDCVQQAEADKGRPSFLLPFEPQHLFHAIDADDRLAEENIDEYGDSYARDTATDELRSLLEAMPKQEHGIDTDNVLSEWIGDDVARLPGRLFAGLIVCLYDTAADKTVETPELKTNITRLLRFGGAELAPSLDSSDVTHVVVNGQADVKDVRTALSGRSRRVPRLVTGEWVVDSWKERTLIDEERYTPV